ncbi:MAG: hypothetical protein E7413_05130 [Ruminococcaceae bacterium]|nr:hypothetical protein [Oscillospiraceae bacterium]
MNLTKRNFLTSNQLKILAAVLMLIDHAGVMLFPDIATLRILGRLSFPIFAFLIAEGCVYTKNKRKYFFSVFSLGAFCQIVFYLTEKSTDLGILITFSCSILLCYLWEYMKKICLSTDEGILFKIFLIANFFLAVFAAYLLNQICYVDYGFLGCMLPLFACAFRKVELNGKTYLATLDHNVVHVISFGFGLWLHAVESGGIQIYSLLAIPLLLLYSGKRGNRKLKLFFYIFYPVHFAVLALIQQLFF